MRFEIGKNYQVSSHNKRYDGWRPCTVVDIMTVGDIMTKVWYPGCKYRIFIPGLISPAKDACWVVAEYQLRKIDDGNDRIHKSIDQVIKDLEKLYIDEPLDSPEGEMALITLGYSLKMYG